VIPASSWLFFQEDVYFSWHLPSAILQGRQTSTAALQRVVLLKVTRELGQESISGTF